MTVSADTSFAGLEAQLHHVAGSFDAGSFCSYHFNHVGNGVDTTLVVSVKLDAEGEVSNVAFVSATGGDTDRLLDCIPANVKRRHFGAAGANAAFKIELTWKAE
jgi:hypothetical protein